MKRFYCTICKRLKRVRKYPASVATPNSENPEQRIGECTRHSNHPGIRRDSLKKVAVN